MRKKSETIGVKVTPDMRDAVEGIAEAKKTTAQELLRRAAIAIIAFADAHGKEAVPLEMELLDPRKKGFLGYLPFSAGFPYLESSRPLIEEYVSKKQKLDEHFRLRERAICPPVGDQKFSLNEPPQADYCPRSVTKKAKRHGKADPVSNSGAAGIAERVA